MDSGCTSNIRSKVVWDTLLVRSIEIESELTDVKKSFKSNGAGLDEGLKVVRTFVTTNAANGKSSFFRAGRNGTMPASIKGAGQR